MPQLKPQPPPDPQEIQDLSTQAQALQARITTAHGDIVFTFYPSDAPNTVASFIKLSRNKFYDGLTFHRVEPGFVVQGGDPSGTGTGGPGYHVKAEFSQRPHSRGAVAMARASDPNSAGSQFYICLDDARFLDGKYTVFGQVESGMDAVSKIRRGDQMKAVIIEERQS